MSLESKTWLMIFFVNYYKLGRRLMFVPAAILLIWILRSLFRELYYLVFIRE